VVELPDLWGAAGAGGEWGDHRQVRGALRYGSPGWQQRPLRWLGVA
jgi:hypothetical protein